MAKFYDSFKTYQIPSLKNCSALGMKILTLAIFSLFLNIGQSKAQADIKINKNQVSDDTPDELQSITFAIEVENTGPNNATGLQILAFIPSQFTISSATTGSGTYTNATGIWDIGNMPDGANYTLNIIATVNAGTANSMINTNVAVFASDQPDPDPANNSLLKVCSYGFFILS